MRIRESIEKMEARVAKISRFAAFIGAAAMFLTIIQICVAVAVRTMGHPVTWSVELGGYALVIVAYTTLGESFHLDEFPSVTLVYERLSLRTRALLRGITLSLSLAGLVLVVWKTFSLTTRAYNLKWESLVTPIPQWIIIAFVFLGLLFLTIQVGISALSKFASLGATQKHRSRP